MQGAKEKKEERKLIWRRGVKGFDISMIISCFVYLSTEN